jgi:hypothetical protein
MVPIPAAIMKAMGYADIKTTAIYISLGKNHMREQAEKRKHDQRPIDLVQAIPPRIRSSLSHRKSSCIQKE